MITYIVLTADVKGKSATVMVEAGDYRDAGSPADYFLPNATDVTVRGTVGVDGEAEDDLPNVLEGA